MESTLRIIVLSCLSIFVISSCDAAYLRVCYYTNWSQYRNGIGKYWPENIEADLCTHIVYAFGKLVGNEVTNFEWNDEQLYERVNALKKQNPEIKTLLAMGGWNAGSVDYSKMVSTASSRKAFIDSSISWLRKYNFDGLDMDWEYPARRGGAAEDYTNFGYLIKEAREAFDNEAILSTKDRLLLTAAVAAGRSNIDGAYDVPTMAQYMDFICIMTYDLHGAWDPVTGHNSPLDPSQGDADTTLNMRSAARYWHELGAPKEKLIIGLATYGRSFTLSDPSNHAVGAPAKGAGQAGQYTREGGFLAYYEICQMQQTGGTLYRDLDAGVPYYVKDNLWVGYDDARSIYDKVMDLIIGEGFGGAMVWSLALDDFNGICSSKKYPLMRVMKDVLEAAENGVTIAPPSTDIPVTAAPTTPGPTTVPTGSTTTTGGGGGGGGGSGISCENKLPGKLYPHPDDCSKFYYCYRGKTTVSTCISIFLFNHIKQTCDFRRNVDCSRSTPSPSTTSTTVITTKSITTKSSTVPIRTGFCDGKADGLYADPTSCSRFYNCWAGNGSPQNCQGDLLWNDELKYCDHDYNVKCDGTVAPSTGAPTTAAPTTAGPTTAAPTTAAPVTSTSGPTTDVDCATSPDGLYSMPGDCTKYIQCASGITHINICPGGLHFNAERKYCDWPENVNCV